MDMCQETELFLEASREIIAATVYVGRTLPGKIGCTDKKDFTGELPPLNKLKIVAI